MKNKFAREILEQTSDEVKHKIKIYAKTQIYLYNMKKILSIPFFVFTWFVCVGQTQPFSLISPSNEGEPVVMFDNCGEFLFKYSCEYSEPTYTDKITHYNNCTEVQFGGFTYVLNYSEDCQWISSYDLFNQTHWLEGFVFIIAEDIILLNSTKDE